MASVLKRARIAPRTRLRRNAKPIQRHARIRQRGKSRRQKLIRVLADLWSWKVRERDGHRCQRLLCQDIGTDAHHIYGKKAFPGVRFDRANGVTLCRRHHDEAHAYPVDFLLEMQARMGERFDALRVKALRVKAVDLAQVRAELEAA